MAIMRWRLSVQAWRPSARAWGWDLNTEAEAGCDSHVGRCSGGYPGAIVSMTVGTDSWAIKHFMTVTLCFLPLLMWVCVQSISAWGWDVIYSGRRCRNHNWCWNFGCKHSYHLQKTFGIPGNWSDGTATIAALERCTRLFITTTVFYVHSGHNTAVFYLHSAHNTDNRHCCVQTAGSWNTMRGLSGSQFLTQIGGKSDVPGHRIFQKDSLS